MKIKLTFIKWAASLLLLSTINHQLSTVFAQGTAFTYQGRLTSGSSPASGLYDFRFKLYTDPFGNFQVGLSYLTNAIPTTNGLFTTTVDFGAGIFTGKTNWLEVDVRTNGGGGYTILSPLQNLTPTPYAVFAESASNLSGTLSAAQLSGPLASANLSGTYGNTVNLNNAGNSFIGNGSGLTVLDASQLISGTVPDSRLSGNVARTSQVWLLGGNSGTTAGTQFIGTTDNQPLQFEVNSLRVMRIEPNTNGAPNIIGGSALNYVASGVVGATIAGGGAANYFGLGYINSVTSDFGTVSGGADNTARGSWATIGGGRYNIASGFASTVDGGELNTASGEYATVGGGIGNIATGYGATVPGGVSNSATGEESFAAGAGANAINDSSFVWSDGAGFSSTTDHQFAIQAHGGVVLAADVQIGTGAGDYHHVGLGTGNSEGYLWGSYPYFNGDWISMGDNFYADANGNGQVFNHGAGTSRISAGWSEIVLAVGDVNVGPSQVRLDATLTGVTVNGTFVNNSDRNVKQDFASVSSAQLLEKVLQLPVSEWSYKVDPTTRHVGPMAQDFHSIFSLGADDKHIAPIDEGGIAFAAIQGLNQKVDGQSKSTDIEMQALKPSKPSSLKQR